MKKSEMTIAELYDITHSMACDFFKEYTYPWEILEHIGEIVQKLGEKLSEDEYRKVGKFIWIHKSVQLPPTAAIKGPTIVCQNAEVRHGAYIRGNVIIGAGAVVGNSTELKNTILFDRVQVPHYNYVGDSVLGYKAHMGAGSITSNVRSDKKLVKIHTEDGDIITGLKKFGAMIGDGVEVGCGTVLNPGVVVGKNSMIYPLSSVRGCVDAESIYKNQGEIAEKR